MAEVFVQAPFNPAKLLPNITNRDLASMHLGGQTYTIHLSEDQFSKLKDYLSGLKPEQRVPALDALILAGRNQMLKHYLSNGYSMNGFVYSAPKELGGSGLGGVIPRPAPQKGLSRVEADGEAAQAARARIDIVINGRMELLTRQLTPLVHSAFKDVPKPPESVEIAITFNRVAFDKSRLSYSISVTTNSPVANAAISSFAADKVTVYMQNIPPQDAVEKIERKFILSIPQPAKAQVPPVKTGPTEAQKADFDKRIDDAVTSIRRSLDLAIQRAVTAQGNEASGLSGVHVYIDLKRTSSPPMTKYVPSVRIKLNDTGSIQVYQAIMKEIKKVKLFPLTINARGLPSELFVSSTVKDYKLTPKLNLKEERKDESGKAVVRTSTPRPKFEPVPVSGASRSTMKKNEAGEVEIKVDTGKAGPDDPVKWNPPTLPAEITKKSEVGGGYLIAPTLNYGGEVFSKKFNFTLKDQGISLTYKIVLSADQVNQENLNSTLEDVKDLLLIALTHYVASNEIEISKKDLYQAVGKDMMQYFKQMVKQIQGRLNK